MNKIFNNKISTIFFIYTLLITLLLIIFKNQTIIYLYIPVGLYATLFFLYIIYTNIKEKTHNV